MYAVIQTGGKQYRVSEGDTLRVEKLAVDAGGEVAFSEVLLVADGDEVKVGRPYVEGYRVTATVESHGRGEKVRILKFRRRKHHLKRQGHRQSYTALKITAIGAA
jgi:large subunit ribosomal protein L21